MIIAFPCEFCEGVPPPRGGAACSECRGKGSIERSVKLDECLQPVHGELSRWFVRYQRNMLPNPGLFLDQPATFVDAIEWLENEMNRIESEEHKRREQELLNAKSKVK